MPLFRLGLFIPYQTPHSQVLAPACGALVFNLEALERNTTSIWFSQSVVVILLILQNNGEKGKDCFLECVESMCPDLQQS